MHGITALSLLALAGSALAMPAPHHRQQQGQGNVVYKTVVYTVVATPGAPAPTKPAPVPQQPQVTSVVEAKPTSAAPVESPAPVETGSSSTGYMATVDEWRGKLGKGALKQDSTLEANALKTAQDGNGQMVHQLNPGSMAQVLAPGGPEDFVKVFVGGWLCERPDMAGMNGICNELSSGWMYTSTGHADILSNDDYTKIGCANAGGIWSCDLA